MALSEMMGNPSSLGFAGAYYGMQDRIRQRQAQEESADMQRQAQAMNLAGLLQQQKQKAAEAQRMQGFRSALQQLGPNATQEQLAQIGAQYADSPDKVMHIAQQSMDRKAAAEQAAANRPDNRPEILRLGEMLEKLPANHPARPFVEKRAAFLAGGERDKATSKWGDPYKGPTGEFLQRNEDTGQIRQVTSRPPVTNVNNQPAPHFERTVDENGNIVVHAFDRTGKRISSESTGGKPQSAAGGGAFTPQALEFVAKQYLRGDRQSIQGFARNSTARIALQNAIVDEAAKQGMSPEQVASQMAEFAGTVAGSRTVGQRAANISLAATEAQEMLGLVKETSDGFARTNFVPWNMALKAYETNTGTPEIAKFGAAVNALVNVYARAINPTGVPTVSDKEHARAVLNTVQSPAQVDAVLGIINRELEIAKKAPETVRGAIRSGITGSSARPSTPGGNGASGSWSIRPKQ